MSAFSKLVIQEEVDFAVRRIRQEEGAIIFTWKGLPLPQLAHGIEVSKETTPAEFVERHSNPHTNREPDLKDGPCYPAKRPFVSNDMTVKELSNWLGELGLALGATTIHIWKWPTIAMDDRASKAVEGYSGRPPWDLVEALAEAPPTEAEVAFSFSPHLVSMVERFREREPIDPETEAILAEVQTRLDDIRLRFEGEMAGPETEARMKAHINDLLGWINSVLPPQNWRVSIAPVLKAGGLHYTVNIDPI